MKARHLTWPTLGAFAAGLLLTAAAVPNPAQAQQNPAQPQQNPAQAQQKRPNIVMLMTDDTGWNDFGAYSGGGAALGHPTPNVDQIAKEGAVFTNWYGQASCTAGRASFLTGRLPIRSALWIVVAPGDPNSLRKETPTIAEFFKKNGYTTYFSGKWHLGDKPEAYPTAHGFDEMKNFAAYYAGVYSYNDISKFFHPWFPSYNPQYNQMFDSVVNLGEWEGWPASRPRGSARSPTTRWRRSTSARRIRRSPISGSTPTATSRSSWT
jgi:arylsulfatase